MSHAGLLNTRGSRCRKIQETLRYAADYAFDYVLPPMAMGKGRDAAYMEIGKCSPL